jgi:hypothetical protein
MTLRRKIFTVAFLVATFYAIAVYIAFGPAPLSVEEQRLVGDWMVAGTDQAFHFGEDKSFSVRDTDLGRWSLEKGALKLHYRGTSNQFWLPASMRGYVYEFVIEFDDSQGIATISDPTAVLPHPVWVRQTKK